MVCNRLFRFVFYQKGGGCYVWFVETLNTLSFFGKSALCWSCSRLSYISHVGLIILVIIKSISYSGYDLLVFHLVSKPIRVFSLIVIGCSLRCTLPFFRVCLWSACSTTDVRVMYVGLERWKSSLRVPLFKNPTFTDLLSIATLLGLVIVFTAS